MTLPVLYKLSKNSLILVWKIEEIETGYCVQYGHVGIKLKKREYTTKKKCQEKCQSLWNEKIKKNYETKIPSVIKPMIPKVYTSLDIIQMPCYVFPKIGGLKCLYQDNVFYFTGENCAVKNKKFETDLVLQGEFYSNTISNDNILNTVMQHSDNIFNFDFYLYDCVLHECYESRLKMLEKLVLDIKCLKDVHVHILRPCVAFSREELKFIENKYQTDGYKGTLIYTPANLYEPGKVSNSVFQTVLQTAEQGDDSRNDKGFHPLQDVHPQDVD